MVSILSHWAMQTSSQGQAASFPSEIPVTPVSFYCTAPHLPPLLLPCYSCFSERDANNRYFGSVTKPWWKLCLKGTCFLLPWRGMPSALLCVSPLKLCSWRDASTTSLFPLYPPRPVGILDRTWDGGTGGWNEELNEQHANFMQMNIYFESTAWVLFLGGLRQQESKRRVGGGVCLLGWWGVYGDSSLSRAASWP